MYGLVNKAVEGMVTDRFGEETWEAIRLKAQVEDEFFVSNESYPDETTYRLVGAAADVLGMEAGDVLEAFGEYWVLKTAKEGYGELMEAGGSNLREFLENLPNFHSRIVLMFPDLKPPRFEVRTAGESSFRLRYFTHRSGLARFVIGLLKGLGKMFDQPVEVAHVTEKGDGQDYDEFAVRVVESGP